MPVQVGVGTPVNFVERASSAGGTKNVGTVRVRGSRAISPIDVSSTETATVLSSAQLARIPVARDTTSVALLAPGTVRGDAAFGNLASFGGASVAENQYFVNGFNITNTFRNLNFSKVPFEAIAETQVKTGGYGAEFGRSLGGVVNQVTKRGTNEFKGGASVYWNPKTATEGNFVKTNGAIAENNSQDGASSWQTNLWAGGALIKDKLFAYGLIGYGESEFDRWGNDAANKNRHNTSKMPFWLAKLDWNINSRNLLELTAFSDETKSTTEYNLNTVGKVDKLALVGTNHITNGGQNAILKYTGFLTDNFTLSALYGHGEFKRNQRLVTAKGDTVQYGGDLLKPATGCPIIVDARNAARRAVTGTYVSQCNITGGSIDRTDSGDKRNQFRVDADWRIGRHALRFGVDMDEYTSIAGTSYEGGNVWRYYQANIGNGVQDIVRKQIVNQGTTVKLKQQAFYIQDNWNVTDNFLAYVGLRWDTFDNLNGDGESFVKIKNQLGPRLGFSWDVNGDSTFKVFGNAGRYALPLTPSVAVRGASASLYTRQEYTFTGVDPTTGAPLGIVPIIGKGSQYEFRYVNGEFGKPKNPATIAATNLKPMYQDEFILGFQKKVTDGLNIGATAIYRNLKQAIDDNCDYEPILDALVAGGVDASKVVLPNGGFPYCRMFNPGANATFLTDPYGTGKLISASVPGAIFMIPKGMKETNTTLARAKRTYQSLEVFADGAGDRYSWHASYVWSRSAGNTEGGVKSDIGQADTSVTQDFDYADLNVDTYGFLPNDRRHTVKLFGSYDISEQLSVGANALFQTGRPYNCLGVKDLTRANGTHSGSTHPYGTSFFRCDDVAIPRGTAGRLPFTSTLDLNMVYRPAFIKGLTAKLDVFNVFNSQKTTAVTEGYESAANYNTSGQFLTGAANINLDTYLLPRALQAPRAYRLMLQYNF